MITLSAWWIPVIISVVAYFFCAQNDDWLSGCSIFVLFELVLWLVFFAVMYFCK